jgi:hypothetical protein
MSKYWTRIERATNKPIYRGGVLVVVHQIAKTTAEVVSGRLDLVPGRDEGYDGRYWNWGHKRDLFDIEDTYLWRPSTPGELQEVGITLCPQCERHRTEKTDYLCHACRWGV